MKSNAVVFVAMTYPNGGIRHFTLLANELNRQPHADYDLYYASIAREADKGCWALARSHFADDKILESQDFKSLVGKICDLAKSYERVLVHAGGGWGQSKHFVQARKRMDKMLSQRLPIDFIATTHSYRNDSIHRFWMSAFQYVLYRLFYRMVVFQCSYAADRFVGGRDLIRRGMGTIIPLGCEVMSVVNDVPSEIETGGWLPIFEDKGLVRFVYLAAYRPGKKHVWLVRSVAPILRKHPNVRVFLCGSGDAGVFAATREAIRKEGLEDRILMTGQIQRQNVPWVLQHCSCALVPSSSETFGHCFLEPMFAGLPIVGTRVGIGRDILCDGETGCGFSLSDKRTLWRALENIILDPERAREMGANAKRLVEGRFTHECVARQLTALYVKLLNGDRRNG